MDEHRKQELRFKAQKVDAALSMVLPVILQILKNKGFAHGRIMSTDPLLAADLRMAFRVSGSISIGPGAEADNASVAIGPETVCHGGKISIDIDWMRSELRRIHGGGRA